MEFYVVLGLIILSALYHMAKDNAKKEAKTELEQQYNRQLLEIKNRIVSEYNFKLNQLEQHNKSLAVEKEKLKKKEIDLEVQLRSINHIIEDNSQSYPWLASLFADYYYLREKRAANNLIDKARPAFKAADKLKEISVEKRELQKLCKMYEYQINYWESLFPWLEDFKEVDPKSAYSDLKSINSIKENDAALSWLSPTEYNNLSSTEKYQRALDRYLLSNKTNWQAGIDFERYIGYCCETLGYKVNYSGATLGLEDMGRDLIVKDKDSIYVIQCKRWSKEKTIHEKHIFQLFGSVVLMQLQNPKKCFGVFVTTTSLSDTARSCANHLGIIVKENLKMINYPLIKCNISSTGEKIYHLPFDQQYDRVVIDCSKGEFYALTISEAESKGFRRAMKWLGN